jgi:hypothetical protein
MTSPARQIRENVGNLVATITIPETVNSTQNVHPQNFEQIASYNWIDDRSTPTIVAPGSSNHRSS